jgi:short-subunit dehydrogenase
MHVLIFGATSDIAQELAKQYAQRKADVTLLGIDTAMLAPFKADLEIRYSVKIKLVEFDILNYSAPDVSLISLIDSSDVSIMLIGYLGDQDKADENDNELLRIINLNYVKVVEVISQIQRIYVNKKSGLIAGVSSVAGDRGKQSNFAYGSAKAGLSVYLDGLRNRLYPKGIHVLTIKPGFMATKMTEHMDLPKPLTASPKAAAKAIINAIDKKKNKIYINWIWKYLMMVIKTIPEPVFKKMKM